MRGNRIEQLEAGVERLRAMLDTMDRRLEKIEVVTLVREPGTASSADAYNGLRKQVIAAVGERNAHLHQLAQFAAALDSGATADELRALVGEWLEQSSITAVDDPSLEEAFEVVGPADAPQRRVVRPGYVDRMTGRVVRRGVIERLEEADPAGVAPATDQTGDPQ